MTDPYGGFYSTQDADREGEEGKFFVWTPAEIWEILGEEAETFIVERPDAGRVCRSGAGVGSRRLS